MKTQIVFDYDDTISASYMRNQNFFTDTIMRHFPQADEKLVRDIHYSNKGISMITLFEIVGERLNIELDPAALLAENQMKHTQDLTDVRVFPGFQNFIKNLKDRGKTLSILSNRETSTIIPVLKHHKIDTYFSKVISCYEAGFEKPDPKCLLDLIEENGVSKKEYLYVGDSKTDAEFATRAGVDFIVVDHYLNLETFYQQIIDLFV